MDMKDNKGRFQKGHHWRPPKPFWERDYLIREYVEKGRSSTEIADEHGIKPMSLIYWLQKHGIPRRTTSEARKKKHWGASGASNPMFGLRGDQVPNWKGGVAPERQRFYSSLAWKEAVQVVMGRDSGVCRRCGANPNGYRKIVIHHLVPFKVKRLRAELSNLITLCSKCHGFVHSKKNINGEFISREGGVTS